MITRKFVDIVRKRLLESGHFMQVIVGPRQVGKTTGITQVFEDWDDSKHMASADLPSPPTQEWIIEEWERARRLTGSKVLLVLDEIQKIERWSEVVKMLFDEDRAEGRMRVALLGSASMQIQSGLTETLAGRFERTVVPHWSYQESRSAFDWDFDTYLRYGGYPDASKLIDDSVRWQSFMRDSIIEPALSRDILGATNIRKPALFRQTFEIAMHHPAQEISLQKLLGQLQDSGNATTIRHYLELLEGAFLLKLLPKYSKSIITEKRGSPKLLPLCPAVVHSFVSFKRLDSNPEWRGRIVETVVGSALAQRYRKISHWRERQYEVDFVVEEEEQLFAIEVKAGRPRNMKGLNQFLKQNPAAIPVTISMNNLEEFLLQEEPLVAFS